MYEVIVALVVAVHYAFVLYLVVGGFIALRWRWAIWLHIPVVVWGALIVTFNYDCPLTWLERWARREAGMAPLPPEGFIAHYITGVLYPPEWVDGVRVAVFAVVALSWALFVASGRRRKTGQQAGALQTHRMTGGGDDDQRP